MAQVTFDTLEYMNDLKKSGMDQKQAEAITKATAHIFDQMMDSKDLATKADLLEVKSDLRSEIKEMKSELIKYIHENSLKTIGILATFQTIILGLFGLIQYLVK